MTLKPQSLIIYNNPKISTTVTLYKAAFGLLNCRLRALLAFNQLTNRRAKRSLIDHWLKRTCA